VWGACGRRSELHEEDVHSALTATVVGVHIGSEFGFHCGEIAVTYTFAKTTVCKDELCDLGQFRLVEWNGRAFQFRTYVAQPDAYITPS